MISSIIQNNNTEIVILHYNDLNTYKIIERPQLINIGYKYKNVIENNEIKYENYESTEFNKEFHNDIEYIKQYIKLLK